MECQRPLKPFFQTYNNIRMIEASYQLKRWLFLLTLVLLSGSSEAPVPSTFGLITVTHTRAGDNSQFMKYLKRYAFMQCPIINEISIIWNNQKSMQDLGIFAQREHWKIPIYFYKTEYNSMYWRYNIPTETKSEVFFSIDDDIVVGCEQLMKGFEVWRKNAIGNVAPMVTYGARFYEFTLEKGFEYGRKREREYFNTGLNLAFVSRHFLQLYYADLWELNEFKKHILKKNNCDDIALNWIIQYFYPQLPTIVIQGNIENRSPAVAQSTTSSHYKFRNQCLKDFTDIFGFNPLRYIRIKDLHPNREKKLAPLVREVVLAKQRYLTKYILKKQPFVPNGEPLVKDPQPPRAPARKEETQLKIVPQQPQKPQEAPKTVELDLRLKKQYEQKIAQLQLKQKQLSNQIQQNKRTPETQVVAGLNKKIEQEQTANKELILKNYWRSYFELALTLIIIVMLWRICDLSRQKSRKSKSFKLQSNQLDQTQQQA